MPLWRKLHSKIVDSPDVNDMPDDFTRLLWALLPLQLDSAGRGLDNPAWIRSKVFPLREDVTVEMVDAAMEWYARRRMIERYSANGRAYFWVPTWHKHQGKCDRESPSNYPAPASYGGPSAPPPQLPPYSRLTQDLRATDSRLDVEENRVDVEETLTPALPAANAAVSEPDNHSLAKSMNLDAWLERIKQPPNGSNRNAVLREMGAAMYPGRDPPPYSRFGITAKKVGGAARLAQLLWQSQLYRVTGDYLSYVLKMGTAKNDSTTRLEKSFAALQEWGDG